MRRWNPVLFGWRMQNDDHCGDYVLYSEVKSNAEFMAQAWKWHEENHEAQIEQLKAKIETLHLIEIEAAEREGE